MASFIDEADQTAHLLLSNLERASDLIASFKRVAVDQTSETEREFVLGDYVQEILQSLKPSFKHTEHSISVNCKENFVVNCAPGAIAQIITNMVVNSITHGFEGMNAGNIQLDIREDDGEVVIEYRDDGRGLSKEELDKLFDAFYTTKRGEGGSGLGTHIMYNLVTQSLHGQIDAKSTLGKGLCYTIRFPINASVDKNS